MTETAFLFHTVLGIPMTDYILHPYFLLPFCIQYTPNTVRGFMTRRQEESLVGSVTSVTPSRTPPPRLLRFSGRDLCLFSFVIYAYIPSRSQRN